MIITANYLLNAYLGKLFLVSFLQQTYEASAVIDSIGEKMYKQSIF